jgi:Flp pilus assembly protein TadG
LIESVFVLFTLLAMVLFIVEMSRIMLAEQYLAERARAAARMAAVHAWSPSEVANYVAYNSTSAPGGGTSTPGLMGVLPSNVAYSVPTGPDGDPSNYVKVTIRDVRAFTVIPYMAGTYTLPTITVSLPAQSLGKTD